jgi:hypothetical protein
MSIKDRGFASMPRDKQRAIATKGGKAAHKVGTAHEWSSEEAREAGRKGGLAKGRAMVPNVATDTPAGQDERVRGDDDGIEYADPRDEQAERRDR